MSAIRYCLDDRWLSAGEPALAPSSDVITAGAGWFETLRIERGRPMFESAHLHRLESAIARAYGSGAGPVEALRAGRAARRCLATMSAQFRPSASGRLRLLLARDDARDSADFGGWQALGEWSDYHPPAVALERGIEVVVASFPHPGLGFLGKSVSYHWSLAARQEARARGADEALLVRDGQVLEAASGALAWCESGRWFVHQSSAVLPSVTVEALRRAGVVLECATLPLARLDPASNDRLDGLIVISALRLALSVRCCEGTLLADSTSTASTWRCALLDLHAAETA